MLVPVREYLAELSDDEATVCGDFYSCVEQIGVKTAASEKFDDVFNVGCGSFFFEDVEENWEGSERHLG